MNPALLIGGVAVCSVIVTWMVRRYAIRASLLDVPNERSSHSVPTPRGGGIGIFAGLLLGLCGALMLGWIDARLFAALVTGGTLVAGIGFLDDHRHVPARIRASVHLIAALVALGLIGGLQSLRLGTVEATLGPVGWLLGGLGIVWSINLYNFMDGIDGLAASEALVVCGAGALLAWLTGAVSVAVASSIVAAAATGFLVWNWAPARIFMGDVGSGLFGYCIAVLAIASENAGGPPLLLWVLLGGVFFWDATVTLVRRMLRGERWFEAHRLHAYQRAVQAGWSHAAVSGAIVGLNLLLAVIAYLALTNPEHTAIVVICAVLLVVGAYFGVERLKPMYDRPFPTQDNRSH